MALKDKMITLGGLDYFNKNVALPHNESITAMANALFALNDVVEDMETRLTTVENFSGSSAELASMFEIGLEDVYHVTDESAAPTIIANSINVDGFAVPIGTSGVKWAKPVVQIPPINWSTDVDDNYDLTASGVVKVWFGQAGAISKTVTFKKPGPGKVLAVSLSNKNSSIDTGIAADYSYTLHAKGHAIDGGTGVIIGGFSSTTERTGMRILPTSNKFQMQWPNNVEATNAKTGIQTAALFEYWQKAGSTRFVQGSLDVTSTTSGNTDNGSPGTNLFLFGDDASSSRAYAVIYFAEVLQGDTQIAYFAPYKLMGTDEIVMLNTSGLTAQQIYDIVENGDSSTYASRILRPRAGVLVEDV